MRKIFALVLVLCLFALPALAAEDLTVTIDTGDSITLSDSDSNGYYEISTADELYAFAAAVNGGKTSINGELTDDITVNEDVLDENGGLNGTPARVWTPIGSLAKVYTGKFDGLEHTVSGLYFNDDTASYVGLFGRVDSGTVSDVGVIDSYFCGYRFVGGVIGEGYKSTVTGCDNSGTVTGSDYDVGGVIGNGDGSTVTDCDNSGTVTGSDYVGGVIGEGYRSTVTGCNNSGTVTGSDYDVGGVIGNGDRSTVTGCNNSGTVTGGINGAGGVIGRLWNGAVSDCHNTGTIKGTIYVGGVLGNGIGSPVTDCYNTGAVEGDYSIGGVVGYNDDEVTDCYNTGTIEGDSDVGGVIGTNFGNMVAGCYNTGTVTGSEDYVGGVIGVSDEGTVTGCYNTGAIVGDSEVGGVIGNCSGNTVTSCYNTGTIEGGSFVGGVTGWSSGTVSGCYYLDGCVANGKAYGTPKTAEQFASGEVAWLLNDAAQSTLWKQNIGEDAAPGYTGSTVYQVKNCKNENCYSNTNENIPHSMSLYTGECTVCELFIAAAKVTIGGEDTYYLSLDDALNAAWNTSAVITVLQDGRMTRGYHVTSGNEVTLDLNGKNVADVNRSIWVESGGKLNITGSGRYTGNGSDLFSIREGGELNISGDICFENEATDGWIINALGKVNITGGTFTAENGEAVNIYNSGSVKATGTTGFKGNAYEFYINRSSSDDVKLDVTGADPEGWRILNKGYDKSLYAGKHIALPEGTALEVNGRVVPCVHMDEMGTIVSHEHTYVYDEDYCWEDQHWGVCACGAETAPEAHQYSYSNSEYGDGHIVECTVCKYDWYGEHTLCYSASGSVITESCELCKADLATATITAQDAVYNGSAQETAAVTYSEKWKFGDLTPAYESNVSAGTAAASITCSGVTASVNFAISPAPVTVTGLEAVSRVYAADDVTVTLTGGEVSGRFADDNLTLDLSAAVGTMADADAGEDKPVTVTGVRLTGSDAANYQLTGQPADVTADIAKAQMPAPTGLTAAYSQTLAQVALPEGWTWAEPDAAVGNVGENSHKANYAGDNNYLPAADVPVMVSVSQSATSMTAELMDNKSEYTYGEKVNIAVTPAAMGAATFSLCRFAAPKAGEVALYNGSEQITDPKTAGNGETVTFTLDTVADGLTPGSYTLTAKYTATGDMAAQETTISFSVSFAEDTPANDAEVSGDKNEEGWSSDDPVLTAPEGGKVSLGCGEDAQWSDSLTLPNEEGKHNYTYYVKDENGHIAEKNVTVMVDKTAPTVEEIDIQAGTDSAEITAPATDKLSGVLDYQLTQNSGKEELTIMSNGDGSFTIEGMAPGKAYDLTLTVRDMVGNTATVKITVTAAQLPVLPATGDASRMGMWALLMAVAGAGMVALRKRAHN